MFSDEEDSEEVSYSKLNESSDDVVKMYNLDAYDDSDINSSDEEGENLLQTTLSPFFGHEVEIYVYFLPIVCEENYCIFANTMVCRCALQEEEYVWNLFVLCCCCRF